MLINELNETLLESIARIGELTKEELEGKNNEAIARNHKLIQKHANNCLKLFQQLASLVHECHNELKNEYKMVFTLTKTAKQNDDRHQADKDESINHKENDNYKTREPKLEFIDDGEIPIPPIIDNSDTCSNKDDMDGIILKKTRIHRRDRSVKTTLVPDNLGAVMEHSSIMKATYGNGVLTPADKIDNFTKHNDKITAFKGLGINLGKRCIAILQEILLIK